SPGTPAFSHPWENATHTQFAPAILAPRIAVMPRRNHVPAPNAGTIVRMSPNVILSLSKDEPEIIARPAPRKHA
ncbi:MAG TPA: hypothetical protein VHS78_15340, partial [Candidatus Elarobacter sp.]|nr:hypothetical protein [Candidatus Elarobacter sp.]